MEHMRTAKVSTTNVVPKMPENCIEVITGILVINFRRKITKHTGKFKVSGSVLNLCLLNE
jgi:hypothetical protein